MKRSIFGLLLVSLFSAEASACSCLPMTVSDFAKNADSVHFATLQEAKLVAGNGKESPSIEGRFLVTKTLKGSAPSPASLTLSTPGSDSECGVGMLVSAKYVIFKKQGNDGILACSGSGVLGRFGVVGQYEEDEIAAEVQGALQRMHNQR